MYIFILLIIVCLIVFVTSNKNKVQPTITNYNPERQFEMERIRVQKEAKWSLWFALGSLILFLLIMIICFGIFVIVGTSNNPATGWLLVIGIWCLPIFIMPMIAFNFLAHRNVKKCQLYNIQQSFKIKNLIKFNFFQIPILVVSCILGIVLMTNLSDRTDLVKEEIENRYGTEYTILYKDHISNEGGTNEIEMLVEVEGMENPLYVNYDIMSGTYSDNYDSYLRSKKVGYKETINKVFEEDIFSYMEVYDNYEGYESASLVFVVDNNNLIDKKEFTNNIEKVLDKYSERYMDLKLTIYYTDKLDFDKEYEYKLLSISGSCSSWEMQDKYSYLYNKYINFYIWNYEEYNIDKLYTSILSLN